MVLVRREKGEARHGLVERHGGPWLVYHWSDFVPLLVDSLGRGSRSLRPCWWTLGEA